jgi:hypothetical protein
MNYFRKIERGLTALALVPFSNLETKERKRRLDERLMRLEQRQKDHKQRNQEILQKQEYS